MRSLLATAFLMAGCLHARGPAGGAAKADAATIHAFELLVSGAETIDDAADFAKVKGLRRDDIAGRAERAYWSFMRAEIYPPAAEIAARFGFGKRAIELPLKAQRKDADKAARAYTDRRREPDGRKKLYAAIWELTLEMRISCRYGPSPKDARETIRRAQTLRTQSGEDDVLYPLLDEGCPVDDALRNSIVNHALYDRQEEFAIRHAAKAGWDDVRTDQFLWHFFNYYQDCTDGVKALVALKATPASAKNLIEKANCESEIIDSAKWKLDPKLANDWFFAAVRGKKYNLALELLPLGTHGENGQVFLFQEAMRVSGETALVLALKMHIEFHGAFMAFLWERGRYRFIGNFSLTLDWQRKAFDKLVELGKWEDAAEAAQYGCGESLRTEGILIAFRAAMAAGGFKAGRYFVARYGPVGDKPGLVTQEMYDEEKDKWYAAKQAGPDPAWMKDGASKATAKAKAKKKRKPPCPGDDWCP